jgi:hypothetical protein
MARRFDRPSMPSGRTCPKKGSTRLSTGNGFASLAMALEITIHGGHLASVRVSISNCLQGTGYQRLYSTNILV